jgi:methylenetetrahydrofolate reductase (NADPH)
VTSLIDDAQLRTGAEIAPAAYSGLQAAFRSGRFVVTAEVGPPHGGSLESFRCTMLLLQDWLDAVMIAPEGRGDGDQEVWVGSLAALRLGVEPMIRLECHDADGSALQADLLKVSALHIANVVLCPAKATRGFDANRLVAMARGLRDERRLLSGRQLGTPPRWLIGVAEDAPRFDDAGRPARPPATRTAGAEFVLTGAGRDPLAFIRWAEQLAALAPQGRSALIATVALDPNERASAALGRCADAIRLLRESPAVSGVHIKASGAEATIPELLRRASLAPRSLPA